MKEHSGGRPSQHEIQRGDTTYEQYEVETEQGKLHIDKWQDQVNGEVIISDDQGHYKYITFDVDKPS